MKEPTIEELEITIKYMQNPHAYGYNEGVMALTAIMYCKHIGITPKELLEKKRIQYLTLKN